VSQLGRCHVESARVGFCFLRSAISFIVRPLEVGMACKQRPIMNASWLSTSLLVLGWTSSVSAQPGERLTLTWSAPTGCPSAENVQARVNGLLGGDASAARVADVRAAGQVERVEGGFRLLLSMGVAGAPSSRVIEARTCDELAGAAAIAIALLARSTLSGASATTDEGEPAASSAELGGENTPISSPEPPAPTPPAKAQPAAPVDSAGGLHAVLDVPVGLAGWGSLPSTALGLGAGLGLRWKALRVVAQGELWAPQNSKVSGFATHFAMQSARVEACLLQSLGGVELAPCLGSAVQRLKGDGLESPVFSPSSRTTLWFSGLAGVFVSLPTPGFATLRFFGEASVLVSPLRPRFVIDQLGPAHEPALAAPRVSLGCEWIF
jgi:hypothetical protein